MKAVGGSTTHSTEHHCAFNKHEFKIKSAYGSMPSTNSLDWPIALRRWSLGTPTRTKKSGVTRTNGIPGLPGNNNFKVLEAGAKKLGYKTVHTGNMAINSRRAMGADRACRSDSVSQGCKSGAKS